MRSAALALMLSLLLASAASATTVRAYDPDLGTLPQAQGFTFFEDFTHPAPTVSGGLLHQGPTGAAGNQLWRRSDLALDFASGPGFHMEADLRVISSGYDPGPADRAGYALIASDTAGH